MTSRARASVSGILVLLVAAAACSSSGGGNGSPTPTPTPTASPTPAPVDHTFVVDLVDVPTSNAEGTTLGFDLDGDTTVDNQLAQINAAFQAAASSIDMQADMDKVVARGRLVFLADVSASALASADATLRVFSGTTSMTPAACTDGTDTICRHQFDGTGAFVVDGAAPSSAIAGVIDSQGTFTGSAASATIPFSVLGGDPFALPLKRVQVRLAGLGVNGWSATGSKLGGAVLKTDFDTTYVPAFGTAVRAQFATDCTVGSSASNCGCAASSQGATWHSLLDNSPADCVISDAEVQAFWATFSAPDVDLDGDGTNDAISIGIGLEAVKGTFTVP